MRLDQFKKTFSETVCGLRMAQYLNAALVAAVLLLAIAVLDDDKIIVLTPPQLSDKVELTPSTATAEFKRDWGVYLATLMGNLTPDNVGFVTDAVSSLLSPALYQDVRASLAASANLIRTENLSVRFSPSSVQYEPKTDKVFVTGQLITQGPSGEAEHGVRTYEFIIGMRDYKARITHIAAYDGAARLQGRLNTKKAQEQEAQKEGEL